MKKVTKRIDRVVKSTVQSKGSLVKFPNGLLKESNHYKHLGSQSFFIGKIDCCKLTNSDFRSICGGDLSFNAMRGFILPGRFVNLLEYADRIRNGDAVHLSFSIGHQICIMPFHNGLKLQCYTIDANKSTYNSLITGPSADFFVHYFLLQIHNHIQRRPSQEEATTDRVMERNRKSFFYYYRH